MTTTSTPAARRYVDPEAAADILARLGRAEARLTGLDLCTQQLTMLAATLAWTYVNPDGPQAAADRYFEMTTTGQDSQAREKALEALAWQAAFGPSGSSAQRAASRGLSWSPTHHTNRPPENSSR